MRAEEIIDNRPGKRYKNTNNKSIYITVKAGIY